MPYFDNLDTYINPYYLDVNPIVRGEMYSRAQYYGARTKTGINSSLHQGLSNTIDWPYRKMPWASVTAKYFETATDGVAKEKLIVLGFDTDPKKDTVITGTDFLDENGRLTYEPITNSDKNGNLTLYESDSNMYESARNVPKHPLLTSIEISNEGQRGALLKGKFSFTFFPRMLPSGFELEAIQRIFFTPGNRVNIGFGWSISAFDTRVNKLEFTGIIYGFNWNFNQNTSITAEVQVVSPSTLAIGLSGEQTIFQTADADNNPEVVIDPTGRPLPKETNILNIIQRDLRSSLNNGIQVSATGIAEYVDKNDTRLSGKFNYFKIGLPTVIGSSFEDASAARLAMTAEEREVERQQEIVQTAEALTTDEQTSTSIATDSGISGNSLESIQLGTDNKENATPTEWNNGDLDIKPTASTQLRSFLQEFISNNYILDENGSTPAWLNPWITTYRKKEMSRYVWFKDRSWDSRWVSNGFLAFGSSNTEQQDLIISDLTVKDFDDMIKKLNGITDSNEKIKWLKRKIAQLAAIELTELKNTAFYHKEGNDTQFVGRGGEGRRTCQFWLVKGDDVIRNKNYWPDNLQFCLSDSYGDGTDRVVKMGQDLWDNAFEKYKTTKDLRSKLKGEELKTAFRDGIDPKPTIDPKNINGKPLEERLNQLIQVAKKFAKDATVTDMPKKQGSTEDSGESPKAAVTEEEKQKLNQQISELKTFQSDSSTADVFLPTDNQKKKDWIAKYPNDKFVGGIDVKTITDNWLVGIDYTGVPANLIATKKAQTASSFVQKLIDAKEEQKKNGKDTAKDLLKIKSPAYQESLNNASTQNGDGTQIDNGGGGSDGTTTDPGMAQQYQANIIGQTYWYIPLKDLVEFANTELLAGFNNSLTEKEKQKYTFQQFKIQCENNEAEYQPDIKSAFPQNVYFPDVSMGGYETFNPFYDEKYANYLRTFEIKDDQLKLLLDTGQLGVNVKQDGDKVIRIEDDVINIGNILIGINLIIQIYRGFLIDNATNISYKNITSFFDQIIKEINAASGDTYQLVSHLFTEPEKLKPNAPNPSTIGDSEANKLAVLSIEDTHIARKHSQTVRADDTLYGDKFADDTNVIKENDDIYSVAPFVFEATIFKPLIKNVSITSKPPKELAFAAYIAARGQEANARGGDFRATQLAKPSSVDATLTRPIERDEAAYKAANEINDKHKIEEEGSVGKTGFTQEWCDNYRTLLTKYKRLATNPRYKSTRGIGVGSQWLNRAIYPVEFTVTIDGINGFKFGDVLKTTMIPRHYNIDWDIVFTVTKIIHKVTPSFWETTLNTAARLSLDNPLTGMSERSDPIGIQQGTPGPRGEIYGTNQEQLNR